MSLYALFLAHWFGDFVCQHRWMAENKSKDILALLLHVGVYTLVLSLAMGYYFSPEAVMLFAVLNALSHGVIDSITSKITKVCWERRWVACFWWTIGFDQMLHIWVLLLTYHSILERHV
jgi:hypothetical protein